MADDRNDGKTYNVNITKSQLLALEKISTSRANNLFVLIDLIADMDVNGLAFMRRIGDKEDDSSLPLKDFLNKSHKATFLFLANAREDEIALLEKIIRLFNAAGIIGSLAKWCFITFGAVFGAMWMFGEKIGKLWSFLKQ